MIRHAARYTWWLVKTALAICFLPPGENIDGWPGPPPKRQPKERP